MEYPVIYIHEELKIINLVLELVPIDAELKKNLNFSAIALALKPRLNNIANNMAYSEASNSKEKEPVKPEWQPKFKVGDWVLLDNILKENTKCNSPTIHRIYWVNHVDQAYTLESPNEIDRTTTLFCKEDRLQPFKPMQELKDQLEGMHQAFKSLYGSGLKVTDIIAKSDFKFKHKWVELSEFVKNNPDWVKNNIGVILAECELFYKKGDLIAYSYERRINNFIFIYKPGITKLMMPLCGFEE